MKLLRRENFSLFFLSIRDLKNGIVLYNGCMKENQKENQSQSVLQHSDTKWKDAVLVFGTIALILIVIFFMQHNYFRDPRVLQKVIAKFGPFGPIVFIVFQAIEVIVPILPGGVSGSLAMLCFGTVVGFIYSYIGVIIGSCLAFWLVRKYGVKILEKLVNPEVFNKYYTKLQDSKNFNKFFALMIFLPIAPDDLMCMVAGLSKMKFKTFLIIILLGKPISSFMYSYIIVRLMALI